MSPTGRAAVFQIHPTRQCNLECRHCYSRSGPKVTEHVDVVVLLRAVTDAAATGYNVLGVSGGEPLLYPALPEVLDCARSLGMTTTVTTNAMLLSQLWIDKLAGRVDLVAVSVDGIPDAHVAMRQHPNAFTAMARNVERLRDSGINFGIITTLTQHNVDQLSWVADFAAGAGASLLQIHPLELVGNAEHQLTDSCPDVIELLYAAVETVRLRSEMTLRIHLDVNAKTDLYAHPDQYYAGREPETALGSWLSPLVLESSGHVVPLTYGFNKRYGLGNVSNAALSELVERWDRRPFLQVTRRVWNELVADDAPDLCNWYEAVTLAAR